MSTAVTCNCNDEQSTVVSTVRVPVFFTVLRQLENSTIEASGRTHRTHRTHGKTQTTFAQANNQPPRPSPPSCPSPADTPNAQEPPNLKRQSLRFPPVTHQWSGGHVTERNTLPVMEPVDGKPLGSPRFYKHDLLQVRRASCVVHHAYFVIFILLVCIAVTL